MTTRPERGSLNNNSPCNRRCERSQKVGVGRSLRWRVLHERPCVPTLRVREREIDCSPLVAISIYAGDSDKGSHLSRDNHLCYRCRDYSSDDDRGWIACALCDRSDYVIYGLEYRSPPCVFSNGSRCSCWRGGYWPTSRGKLRPTLQLILHGHHPKSPRSVAVHQNPQGRNPFDY